MEAENSMRTRWGMRKNVIYGRRPVSDSAGTGIPIYNKQSCRYVFIRFTKNYISDYINSYIEKKLEIQSGFRIQPSGSDMNMLRSLVGITETEVINRQRKCL